MIDTVIRYHVISSLSGKLFRMQNLSHAMASFSGIIRQIANKRKIIVKLLGSCFSISSSVTKAASALGN